MNDKSQGNPSIIRVQPHQIIRIFDRVIFLSSGLESLMFSLPKVTRRLSRDGGRRYQKGRSVVFLLLRRGLKFLVFTKCFSRIGISMQSITFDVCFLVVA